MSEEKEVKDVKIAPEPKKRAAAAPVKPQGNINNLPLLVKDFESGKLPLRTVIVLKSKLTSLYESKQIIEPELKLMRRILNKERAKNGLSSAEVQLLNKIEVPECVEYVECHMEYPHTNLFLSKGLVCPMKRNPDNERYIVYIPHIVQSEYQLTYRAAIKLSLKQELSAEDLPPSRVDYLRKEFKESEFHEIFTISNLDLESYSGEEEKKDYTF